MAAVNAKSRVPKISFHRSDTRANILTLRSELPHLHIHTINSHDFIHSSYHQLDTLHYRGKSTPNVPYIIIRPSYTLYPGKNHPNRLISHYKTFTYFNIPGETTPTVSYHYKTFKYFISQGKPPLTFGIKLYRFARVNCHVSAEHITRHFILPIK